MKRGKILEYLWYEHESLRMTEWSREANKILDELEACEDKLFPDLTPEQQEALNTYKVDVNDLRILYEKEAFMKGVQFATAYMIEALGQTDKR